MIDITAPIIPYVGLGGIRLYSTLEDLADILQYDAAPLILHGEWIRYDIHDCIELFFHLRNRKLFRITTLGKYEGKLFDGISVGSTEDDMLRIEPSFVYDEFEEVWETPMGAFIEMEPSTNTVRWISVYIHELDSEEFDQADW